MLKQDLINKFGNKFDYSYLPNKFSSNIKLKLNCNKHGYFEIYAKSHYRSKTGCPKCSNEAQTFSKDEIISKANKIFNNFYSYDKFVYNGMLKKTIITCPIHGDFKKIPADHIYRKQGCPKCSNKKPTYNSFSKNDYKTKLFNNLPNMNLLSEYKNLKTKVKVKCECCNETFDNFSAEYWLKAKYCPNCKNLLNNKEIRQDLNKKISKEYIIPDNIFKNKNQTITIEHNCGFKTTNKISAFLRRGCKCQVCYPNDSKGSLKIKNFLISKNIKYEKEKTFQDLYDKQKLKYDYFIASKNLLIEFDGEQHFRPAFGKDEEERKSNFEITKKHDNLKNQYAQLHNIKLLRIKYNEEEHINEILNGVIFQT